MPALRDFIKRLHTELNPDEVVALGAAVQAQILSVHSKSPFAQSAVRSSGRAPRVQLYRLLNQITVVVSFLSTRSNEGSLPRVRLRRDLRSIEGALHDLVDDGKLALEHGDQLSDLIRFLCGKAQQVGQVIDRLQGNHQLAHHLSSVIEAASFGNGVCDS